VAKIISRAQIAKAIVGEGSSYRSILSSAILATTFFFYIYTFGSYFRIPVYVIQNRLTYTKIFADTYIINRNADHLLITLATVVWLVLSIRDGKTKFVIACVYGSFAIGAALSRQDNALDVIALLSIPIIVSLLVYNNYSHKKILNQDIKLSLSYFAIICIAIGVFSVIISCALIVFPSIVLLIPHYVRNYTYDIFLLISSSCPILMFLLINSFALKLLLNVVTTKLPRITNYVRRITLPPIPYVRIKSRNNLFLLSLIALLSVVIVVIPHEPTVNRTNKQIGTDTRDYVSFEKVLINSKNNQDFLQNAFVRLHEGDRPFALIILFLAIKILHTPNLTYALDLVPLALAPALLLTVFFLTREMTSNDIASLLAAFLTAVSFQTLIGIYAGFYANWLALILSYLSITFLMRSLKSLCKINVILFFTFDLCTLFSHTYTWTIVTMVMSIYLLFLLLFRGFSRRNVFVLLSIIMSSLIIDLGRMEIMGTSGSLQLDMNVAGRQAVGIGQLTKLWSNLQNSTQIYLGGLFSNFIIIGLGLYWLFRSRLSEPSNVFLIIFLAVGFLPLFFAQWIVQSRVFYNIPFQIPSAIALAYIMKNPNGRLILLGSCLWLIAVSIKALFNF
jgi:hypothetical protein